MKSLHDQIAESCTHFNGMQNDKCKAGVEYDTVKDVSRVGFGRWPCWREGECLPCEKRHFPTPDEVEAEIAEIEASSQRSLTAMRAAHEDATAKGFKRGNGGVGKIACPVCKTGDLHYSVAGYNGHMHGRCSTKNCVSWMQ